MYVGQLIARVGVEIMKCYDVLYVEIEFSRRPLKHFPRPPNFLGVKCYCSNVVKSPEFNFDVNVPRDSLHGQGMTPYKIFENGAWPESRDLLKLTWYYVQLSERLLVKMYMFAIALF